jgi:hypothetical protein
MPLTGEDPGIGTGDEPGSVIDPGAGIGTGEEVGRGTGIELEPDIDPAGVGIATGTTVLPRRSVKLNRSPRRIRSCPLLMMMMSVVRNGGRLEQDAVGTNSGVTVIGSAVITNADWTGPGAVGLLVWSLSPQAAVARDTENRRSGKYFRKRAFIRHLATGSRSKPRANFTCACRDSRGGTYGFVCRVVGSLGCSASC